MDSVRVVLIVYFHIRFNSLGIMNRLFIVFLNRWSRFHIHLFCHPSLFCWIPCLFSDLLEYTLVCPYRLIETYGNIQLVGLLDVFLAVPHPMEDRRVLEQCCCRGMIELMSYWFVRHHCHWLLFEYLKLCLYYYLIGNSHFRSILCHRFSKDYSLIWSVEGFKAILKG